MWFLSRTAAFKEIFVTHFGDNYGKRYKCIDKRIDNIFHLSYITLYNSDNVINNFSIAVTITIAIIYDNICDITKICTLVIGTRNGINFYKIEFL